MIFVTPNVFFLPHSAKLIDRKTLYSRHIYPLEPMLYSSYSDNNILIQTGKWSPEGAEHITESFTVLTLTDTLMSFNSQTDELLSNVRKVVETNGTPVFMRFFLSDPSNQTAGLKERLVFDCPVSIIGQAPLNGTKIAAMVWCRESAAICRIGERMHKVTERGIDEYWYTGGLSASDGSYNQTVGLLDELSAGLEAQGLTLESDCMRTWLFVQNIDVNYKGVVEGRNTVFDRHGLTPDTHFIASTGIEGRTADCRNKVMLDAVAAKGPGMAVKYLHGDSHLNRTSEYGVRFERGTVVEYPDRRHVYISGTASIDNNGKILYNGDIVRQTNRMIENVEVLLAEAGCGFSQVGAVIVYLRDIADYSAVKKIFDTRFPDCPRVIVQAPVCRPGWLVEMECIAIY